MNRYIGFLRGINISGKNKIVMAELRKSFENLNFLQVKSYLNSGNILFSSDQNNIVELTIQIETMIKNEFDLEIKVFIILKSELEDILQNAPDWWGNENNEIYDNLIFILPPYQYSELLKEIGEPKKALEKIENYKNTIFWSFSRKDYQKTNWWSKTAKATISHKLTIRTANTLKKIIEL